MAIVPGRYGWTGGLGTTWANNPEENLCGILMTRAYPLLQHDFATAAARVLRLLDLSLPGNRRLRIHATIRCCELIFERRPRTLCRLAGRPIQSS